MFAREHALCSPGPPNAGKSSVFNALIGRERAIVSPHPGTTRDTIEATVDLAGVPVTFVDTAGLREPGDEIERIGMERAQDELAQADFVLLVLARECISLVAAPEAEDVRTVVLMNKCDLQTANQSPLPDAFAGALFVSALTREGLESLERLLAERLLGNAAEDEFMLTSARHAHCLERVASSLDLAVESINTHQPDELVMVDLRNALIHLGEILGIGIGDEILDRIFSHFCLGK